MAVLARLLKVGSIADSIGVYVPTKMLQKGIGLVRLLLFMYLMTRVQYGLWGLGISLFTVAAPVLSLGSQHGLMRYAGLYEARGQLKAFCRRMQWAVPAVTLALTAAAFAASGLLTDVFIVSRHEASGVTYSQQRMICWAALANAAVLALYYNLLGLMYGLRTYRLAAAVELLFGVAFTGLGIAVLVVGPTGLAALWAHLAALAVSLAAGLVLIHVGLDRLAEQARTRPAPVPLVVEAAIVCRRAGIGDLGEPLGGLVQGSPGGTPEAQPPPGAEPPPPATMDGAFRRVLRFGTVSLVGATLWGWAVYVSFWLTNRVCGTAAGGIYHAFLSLGQLVLFIAEAIWAVLFTYVARRWESGQRATAMYTLETAYKAVAMAMLTVTILVWLAAPAWVRVLPEKFRDGQELLPGLLLFFQVLIQLALVTIVAKLRERPVVIALAAAWAIGANVVLALSWLPMWGPSGAALAAGVGAYLGAGLVGAAYLLLARVRLAWSTYAVLAAPAILLLPMWLAAAAWACVLAVALFTPLVFDAAQKRLLLSFRRRMKRRERSGS